MLGYCLFFVVVVVPLALLLKAVHAGRERGSFAASPFGSKTTIETPQQFAADGGQASTSIAPSPSGVEQPSFSKIEPLKLVKPSVPRSPREALLDEMQERSSTGSCLVCPSAARMPAPEVRVVPMAFSWLARWLGAIPVERIVIDPRPATGTLLFCVHHHAMALKQLDERVAICGLDQAEFSRKQSESWRTYQRFGLIEEMRSREKEILADGQKKRKSKLSAVPAANQANSAG